MPATSTVQKPFTMPFLSSLTICLESTHFPELTLNGLDPLSSSREAGPVWDWGQRIKPSQDF